MSPLRVLIAPDSYKGSLSASEASQSIARGIQRADSEAFISHYPMADGGEGSLQVLSEISGFTIHICEALDPVGRPVTASYAVNYDGSKAIIELAVASGLTLLTPDELSPLTASTYGTGIVIREAAQHLKSGAEVTVCLGGSATNDGGTGLLRALGFKFLDEDGSPLQPGGGELNKLVTISSEAVPDNLRSFQWRLSCDVKNPLLGLNGAAATFGPQKGATPYDIEILERGLTVLAGRLMTCTGIDVRNMPGAGAAGGCAGTLHALLGAEIVGGATQIARVAGLQAAIESGQYDLLLTGEGRFDEQSGAGKVIGTLSELAARVGLPVVALCGSMKAATGFPSSPSAAFAIADGPLSLQDSQYRAAELLEQLAEQVGRLWLAAQAQRTGGAVMSNVPCAGGEP